MKKINLEIMGGISSIYLGLAYIIGILFYTLILNINPAHNKLETLINNQLEFHIITLIIYIFFGLFLIIFSLSLHQTLKKHYPNIINFTTILGIFWAFIIMISGLIQNVGAKKVIEIYQTNPELAISTWTTLQIIQDALGGGTEIIGGIWILLISIVALKSKTFPKPLNYLGIIIGIAGISSEVPMFSELGGMIFGLTQIIWFIWLGIILIKEDKK
ncbi:MAG: DUF4386 family protein [Nanoarchaeales archaeon]|nr:DUF4386 family protein [Nanoarchaeales archaeon]